MKLLIFILLVTAAIAQLLPVRLMPRAPLNVTNIANVHFAEDAIEMIQDHGIWIPDVANLTDVATILKGNFTQLSIYLNSIVDMKEEMEKYSKSFVEKSLQLFVEAAQRGPSRCHESFKIGPPRYLNLILRYLVLADLQLTRRIGPEYGSAVQHYPKE